MCILFFFFNDTATTEIYTLSLHDALPISDFGQPLGIWGVGPGPYRVLPFLPPLTVRDGVGYAADGAMNPLYYYIPFFFDQLGMKVGETINDRSLNLDLFQGIEESTIDLYSSV